jgi:RNA polymerase sigma-70 factor (ECF subfamily)
MSDQTPPSSFPTTRWSLVNRAGKIDGTAARQALTEIVQRYLPPLRSHLVRRQRVDPHRADDLIQSFLADKVLEDELIGWARQERGKFRTFLLTALDRFVISEGRAQRAKKRSPDKLAELDEALDQSASAPSVDEQFDIEWARQVIDQAVARMQKECTDSGRRDVWGVFELRVLNPMLHGTPPLDYAQLVERFSLESPAQASNVMVTGKRMFVRCMRSLIAEYVGDDEQRIDEELGDLQRIAGRTL